MGNKGDIGVEIIYDTEADISAATVLKLKYRKPSGVIGTWDAVLEGITALKYVTLAIGDLPESEIWELQPYIEMPGFIGHGVIRRFCIDSNIE